MFAGFTELLGMNPNAVPATVSPTNLLLTPLAVLVVGFSELDGDYGRVKSRVEPAPNQPRVSAPQGRCAGGRQASS